MIIQGPLYLYSVNFVNNSKMIESTAANESAEVTTTEVLDKNQDAKHFKEGLIDFTAGSLGVCFEIAVFIIQFGT